MGLMKFSAEGIKQIKQIFNTAVKTGGLLGKPVENSYMTDLLQAVIDADSLVTAVPIYGNWVEIDTADDLHSKVTKNRIANMEHNNS